MSIKTGFGIIEIIVALGLFATVSVTGITMILHSFTTNRLGDEQTTASNLSSAGIEIVRNLRSQSWSNLVAGTYGLKNTAGLWSFSSTPEGWGKFTRSVLIEDGQRDGSGNIINSVGTPDSNLKKVTVTTSWNVGASRNNTVILTDYLTNFSKSITNSGDLILAWGDTTTTPKWNIYTNTSDTFGTKGNLIVGESAFNVDTKTSPTKKEALVGYASATGILHLLCYNGSTWSEDWSVSIGSTGTSRRFDIGYEQTTGNAMVVYSTNTATNNELAYRTKPGSSACGSGNWSAGTNLTAAQTNGIVQWVKITEDQRATQNNLAIAWEDATSALSTMIWNGTSWGNEPTSALDTALERVSVARDADPFDLTYESVSGALMVIWGRNTASNNANGAFYRRFSAGSWGAVTAVMTGTSDDATNLDISSNPASNEIVFASIGNQQNDLQAAYWNGSAWTRSANLDTSCNNPIVGSHKVTTGWLTSGANTRSIVVYDDVGTGNLSYATGNGGTFTVSPTDFSVTPTFGNPQITFEIVMDPKNTDRLMLNVADANNDLFAKRLVMTATPTFTWTNSDGGVALEINLSQGIASPFSAAYWRNP
ncbi:MAG: hypothetical protein WCG44_01690 [bacterium]